MGPGNKSRDDSLCVVRAGLSYTRCVNVVGTSPGMTLLGVARASYPGLPFNPLLHLLHRRARLAGAVEEAGPGLGRSEERRVGKECGSTCRSRWLALTYKKKSTQSTASISKNK